MDQNVSNWISIDENRTKLIERLPIWISSIHVFSSVFSIKLIVFNVSWIGLHGYLYK